MKRHSIQSVISGILITVIISVQAFLSLSAPVYAAGIQDTRASTSKPGTIQDTRGQNGGLQGTFDKMKADNAAQLKSGLDATMNKSIEADKAAGLKTSLSTYTDPAIVKSVPGCTGITNKVMKTMAGTMPTDVDSLMRQYDELNSLYKTVSNLFGSNVDTTDKTTGANTKAIKLDAQVTKFREECMNGVAYAMSKKQLAGITQQTLNWVAHGYDGDPLFVRDATSFFQNIADKQLKDVVSAYSSGANMKNYPYGKDLAKSLVNSSKAGSNFNDSVKQDLTNYLPQGATTKSYSTNFASGGWDAWLALTQHPENNPLGFTMVTSQHLADTTANTIQNQKDELAQNNGFLSVRKCIEKSAPVNNGMTTTVPTCTKYETVTPGSVISAQLSTILGSPIRQLELAKGVNDSLDSVFSNLLNQLGIQGLGSLGSFKSANDYTTETPTAFNKVYDAFGVDISGSAYAANGSIITVNKGAGWSAGDTPFDLTKDLGDTKEVDGITGKLVVTKKGVISVQKDYINTVVDSRASLPAILPALGKLDYCIPGPNPRWEASTALAVDSFVSYLEAIYMDDNGDLVKPDPALFEKQFNGTHPWDNLNGTIISKFKVSFGEGMDNFNNKVDTFTSKIPIVGPILGTAFKIVSSIGKSIICLFSKKKCDGPTAAEQRQAQLDAARAQFEAARAFQIDRIRAEFRLGNPDGVSYSSLIKAKYGPGSPMLTESLPSGEPNPAFLPMAQAGLSLTQNIKIYELNVAVADQDYQDLISTSNASIYKLNVIKKKVDVIVAAAQARRAARRKADGLPPVPAICLKTETITYTDAGVMKSDIQGTPEAIFPTDNIIFPSTTPIVYPVEVNTPAQIPSDGSTASPTGIEQYLNHVFPVQP